MSLRGARLGAVALWLVLASGRVAVAQAVFVPVLSASDALVGARLLEPDLAQGRFASVQTRLAVPQGQLAPGEVARKWQIASHTTYAVDCAATPPVASVLEQVAADGVAPASVAAPGQVRTPPQAGAAATFGCLAAQGEGGQAAGGSEHALALAAQAVQQTAGLGSLQHLNCALVPRGSGEATALSLTLSDDPPAVRLGEKWLSAGWVTAEYVAVADAGLDIRLMRATGALRVVSRAAMASVAHGHCTAKPLQTAKKVSGW